MIKKIQIILNSCIKSEFIDLICGLVLAPYKFDIGGFGLIFHDLLDICQCIFINQLIGKLLHHKVVKYCK